MQIPQNNWYVISGGPGTGKTTLIKLLELRGYTVVSEMARHYIDEQIALGKTVAEMQSDKLAFQHAILEHQLDIERNIPKDQITFFDRGIPDTLAYYRYQGLPEDDLIKKAVSECSYKKVFLLDPLPLVPDYARLETESQQLEICARIHEVYDSIPFPNVHIPVMPPDKRVELIVNNL